MKTLNGMIIALIIANVVVWGGFTLMPVFADVMDQCTTHTSSKEMNVRVCNSGKYYQNK